MKTRLIGAVLAVVLAALGTFVLMSYVRGADERALAGTRTTEVLVASAQIPAGTPADELAELVTTAAIPASSVVLGGVESLDQLVDLVATVDLERGEQLLVSRFAEPAEFQALGEVEVPAGLHEVTVSLEPQRVIGGQITAGATVGVFVSDLEAKTTHQVLHKVLVTSIQRQPAPEPAEDGSDSPQLPEGSLLVTIALDAPGAERLVFGMEHGGVWLSAEPDDADETGTSVLNWESVYQ